MRHYLPECENDDLDCLQHEQSIQPPAFQCENPKFFHTVGTKSRMHSLELVKADQSCEQMQSVLRVQCDFSCFQGQIACSFVHSLLLLNSETAIDCKKSCVEEVSDLNCKA